MHIDTSTASAARPRWHDTGTEQADTWPGRSGRGPWNAADVPHEAEPSPVFTGLVWTAMLTLAALLVAHLAARLAA